MIAIIEVEKRIAGFPSIQAKTLYPPPWALDGEETGAPIDDAFDIGCHSKIE